MLARKIEQIVRDYDRLRAIVPLGTLRTSFLRIGSTAFGGFMALISVVQNEMVERKKLLAHGEMLDATDPGSMVARSAINCAGAPAL